ncbi:golgin subfamily A member 6-like protein 26 isoform X2 [Manis pentadactyla]|uniref:golgin subfamily A member 6-like protein 26 isoform X2 n=1 Tax=Manis pentadactyla TaxID=143292 RepID=UPI00255C788F|nr:golgin subfamily A member 6-like protein 26 isoform X2 [Manis pentadactyla]
MKQLSLQEMKEQEEQRQERDEPLQDAEKALAEEQAKIKAAEEEKEHFTKRCEELEQKMADQERIFNGKFASVEEKLREMESQANKNSRKLDEILQVMKEVVKFSKKDEQLQNAEKALAEEQAKIKAAEEEKERFTKRCEELEQKMADQERIFNGKFASVEEKLREMESQANKNSRKLDEKIIRLLHGMQNMEEGTSEEKDKKNNSSTSFCSFIRMILKRLFH